MKKVFLIILFFKVFYLYSQNDTIVKYIVGLDLNFQYKYIFGDKYYEPYIFWPEPIGFPTWNADQTLHPTYSFNGKIYFSYRIFKNIYFKTGIQYFNRKTRLTSNYDTITKYVYPQNRKYYSLERIANTNTIEIPILLDYTYKKIIFGIGVNIGIIDFNSYYSKLYDQNIYTSNSIKFKLNKAERINQYPVSLMCNFDYLVFNKRLPIYITSRITKYIRERYNGFINSDNIYFSLGLNIILIKKKFKNK